MNFTRFVSIILIFIITAKSVIADPLQHIMACHYALPADKKHLSPIYGLALLDSPWLANLRFFGSYGKEDKDSPFQRFEQLTRSKDHPKSATAALIQHLFPSPADNLAITGQTSFLFRQLSMEGLAELILKVDDFNGKEAELIEFLESKVSSTSYKKQFKKKKKFGEYAKMLLQANLEARSDTFSASPHLVHYLLTAYACERSRRLPQNDFSKFLEKLAPGSSNLAQQHHAIDKQGYLDWKNNLEKRNDGTQLIVSGPHLQQLLSDPALAYQLSQACLKYEQLPLQINYSTARVDGVEFSDCCESGLRGLVLFFLYDPETNTLDLSRIPETAIAEFKEFFAEYDPLNPNKFHSKWAALLANRGDQRIVYKNIVGNTRCEIESGIENCLRVLAEVLGEPRLCQDDLKLIDRVRLLELLFTKGESRYDLDNEEDFDTPESVDGLYFSGNSFAFKFYSEPGHTATEFRNRYASPKPVLNVEDLIQLKDKYIPFYANFFPDLLGLKDVNSNQATFNVELSFEQRRKELFENLVGPDRNLSEVVYKFLLSNKLIPTESKLAFIKTVLDLGLFGICEKLPALNHRLALCDSYTNVELLLALSQHSEELRENSFPDLWKRLANVIKERAFAHFMVLARLGGPITSINNSFNPFYKVFLSKEVLDSAVKEAQESDTKLENLLKVVCLGANFRIIEDHFHERILDALHPVAPRIMNMTIKIHDASKMYENFKTSFASLLFGDTGLVTTKMSIRFLGYLSDQEFEDLSYQENQDAAFRLHVVHAAPKDLENPNLINAFNKGGYDHTKFCSYLIERLYQIKPQRLKDFTFRGSHILLHAMLRGETGNTPIIKFLLEKYGHDRAWILKPNDEGKTCLDYLFSGYPHGIHANEYAVLFSDFFCEIKDPELQKALIRKFLNDLIQEKETIEPLEKAMGAASVNSPDVSDQSVTQLIFSTLSKLYRAEKPNHFAKLKKAAEQYVPDFYKRMDTQETVVQMIGQQTPPSLTPHLLDMLEKFDFEQKLPNFGGFQNLLDAFLNHPNYSSLTERFFAWHANYPESNADFFETVKQLLGKTVLKKDKDQFNLLLNLVENYHLQFLQDYKLLFYLLREFKRQENLTTLPRVMDLLEKTKITATGLSVSFECELLEFKNLLTSQPEQADTLNRFKNWLKNIPGIQSHKFIFPNLMD